jgi:hypothetical protein
VLQKTIYVFAEGRCCMVNQLTGERNCTGVGPDGGGFGDGWRRECNRGSFYVDHAGVADPERQRYGASVIELLDHVERTYRVKASEVWPVDARGLAIE